MLELKQKLPKRVPAVTCSNSTGLSKRYGDTVALDGLGFTVAEGQVFGFVGPNGAGKTTTMRIVMGVLAADSGTVRWRGAAADADTRQRFGYMPEERGLYPKMKVGAQLAFLGRAPRPRRGRVRGGRRGAGSSGSGSPTAPIAGSRSSRSATSSGSSSRRRSSTSPTC